MTRRYVLAFAAVACALVLLLGSCSGRRTELKLGFEYDFPPYGYIAEDGSCCGFDIDVAREVCRIEGWELKPIPINWDEKDTLLANGTVDCIWNGFSINSREDAYTISVPYSSNQYLFVVAQDSSVRTVADLADKVVGVPVATSVSEYLLTQPDGIALAESFGLLAQFSDFSSAHAALCEGTLDAVIFDSAIADHYVAQSEGSLRALDEPLLEEQYGVAFRKGDNKLCETINNDLRTLAADGTLQRIAEQYGIADAVHVD